MNRNLNLDISIGGLSNGEACHYQNDEGSTYKDEGLSVGSDHMRLYGDEVEVKTSHDHRLRHHHHHYYL